MLDDLHRDRVTIEKADGSQLGPVAASVQKGAIYVPHAKEPIEMGDILVREISPVTNERYVVTDPGFTKGIGGSIPDSYQAEVRREGTPASQAAATINYNISGNNPRFNQNSIDNSMNVAIESSDDIFEDLKSNLRDHIPDQQRLNELEAIINDMKESRDDGPSLLEREPTGLTSSVPMHLSSPISR